MPRTCSVCSNAEREAIDRAITGAAAYRRIAAQYAVSEQAIRRHRAEHLPEKLALAAQAAQVAEATDLLGELRELRSKAYGLLLKAERQGDLRTALQGVREARACLELLAEMEGELDRRPQVNLLISPEWLSVRSTLMEALRAHPAAALAVAARLAHLASLEQPA